MATANPGSGLADTHNLPNEPHPTLCAVAHFARPDSYGLRSRGTRGQRTHTPDWQDYPEQKTLITDGASNAYVSGGA